MVTAFVLIQARRNEIDRTAETLADMDGIAEVYSVAGGWDLVAVIRSDSNDQLAEIVTNKMLKLEAINNTTTLIAFRTYSKHDLERMFSIGLE